MSLFGDNGSQTGQTSAAPTDLRQLAGNTWNALMEGAQKIDNAATTLGDAIVNTPAGILDSLLANLPGQSGLNEKAQQQFGQGPLQVYNTVADTTTHLYDKVLAPIVDMGAMTLHVVDGVVLSDIAAIPGLPADQNALLNAEAERQFGDKTVTDFVSMPIVQG